MPRSGKTRRVMSNDDGWIMNTPYPLTSEYMWDNMVGPHQDTAIDGFMWSVGGHDTYTYETEIGEKFGDGYDNLDEQHQANVDNQKYLTEKHGGPVTVIAELCKRAGVDFIPSVRMNEHYDMEESSPSYSKLRRDNPQYLIGRGEDIPGPTLEWGIRTGLDYAMPEVREYMASIVLELASRFDIDGIELDYMRHPAFFRIEEAYANRYLMTDFIAYIRQEMDEIGKKKGKALDLIVRVPPTLGDCSRIGLDVSTWIEEDLVDIVIAGGGFIGFETPINEFVKKAEGTGVQIYGCLEALRPTVDELTMRAITARYWEQGITGLYLFNYYSMSQEWKRDALGRLIDQDVLARLDKRYEFDKRGSTRATSQLGFSFQNAIPATQLPTALQTTVAGPSTLLKVNIADDLEGAKADGALGECTVALRLENMGDGDVVEISLNGLALDANDARTSTDGWTRDAYVPGWNRYPTKITTDTDAGTVIEWTVDTPPLKKGVNEIAVRLTETDDEREGEVVLGDIRVWIRYK
jgi:hypothetical protein